MKPFGKKTKISAGSQQSHQDAFREEEEKNYFTVLYASDSLISMQFS